MTESLYKETLGIMDKCNYVLYKYKFVSNPSKSIKNKRKYLLLQAMNTKFTPEYYLYNNRIIDKIRKKYNKKKEVKYIAIRKTDLGENEMIFTKYEFYKLKEIDDEEMFGYSSAKPSYNLMVKDNAFPPQRYNKKYFFNSALDKPQEEIKRYLDWVNLNEVKGSKDNSKNKIISFQKRLNSSAPNLLAGNKKIKLPYLNSPQNYNSFLRSKNLEIYNFKPIALMTKNSIEKGFLNSINMATEQKSHEKLTKEEKMNQIVEKVGEKIERTLNSSESEKKFIYMTYERKQALFENEVNIFLFYVLRSIKREIGPKYFNNLHITYGGKSILQHKETEYNNENIENSEKYGMMRKTGQGYGGKSFGKGPSHSGKYRGFGYMKYRDGYISAYRMIQKNINRLKEERKRVIEKIVC